MQRSRDRGEGHGKLLDRAVREVVPEETHQPLALEQAAAQAHIHEPDHLLDAQSQHPLFEAVQLAGRVGGADQRADGCPTHVIRTNAGLFQRTDDADVRPAAGGAAAQRESYARFAGCGHGLTPEASPGDGRAIWLEGQAARKPLPATRS